MVSGIVKLAKAALHNVDKIKVIALLDCVNLTRQERELIEKTELAGERLCDMAEVYALSVDAVSLIKSRALRKIGVYLTEKLQ
jgi:DNA-directed RNA polymerase specialized sigma24 family protein